MPVLLLAMLLGAPPPARPAVETRPLVVMVALGQGLPPELMKGIPDVLQTEVRRSVLHTWMDPPALAADDLILALGCGSLDEGCVRKLAESMKADGALLVTSKGTGAQAVVTLTMAPVKQPKGGKTLTVAVKDVPGTLQAVKQSARTLLGAVKPTRLAIQTTPPGAQVTMDGAVVGEAPVVINDLPDGKHALKLSKPGFLDRAVDVVVGSGESQEVNVALVAAPVAAAKAPPAVAAGEQASPEGAAPAWKMPVRAAGGVAGAAGAVVGLAGLALAGGGVASWAAYWLVLLLNPGVNLGGSALRIGDAPSTAGGFATMANADRFGILTYALFLPGVVVLALGLGGLAVGIGLLLVPMLVG